ncbi:hypothetical protein TheetDRAFT_2897 [Thermoanaerobacter ethanolicus JW 200]|nr:hypothetical protein TheetDRAFT_2897 [Thermoanaerobacter ethanolicus JW 200]
MDSKDMQRLQTTQQRGYPLNREMEFKRQRKCIVYHRRRKMEETKYKDIPARCLK